MVDVYAVKLDEKFNNNIYNRLISCVSEDKKEKIKRYYRFEDAKRALIGDILVRFLICKKQYVKNKQLFFSKNEFGKPFLIDSPNFEFNTSHSGEWIVCATHDLPVGIDVELIKPIDFYIAKRYFSEVEYKDLMQLQDSERLEYFYELWTLKESYIKAVGKGLIIPLNSFSIRSNNQNINIITKDECLYNYFKQYKLSNNYKMSVCSSENDFCDKATTFTVDELYEEMCKYEFF